MTGERWTGQVAVITGASSGIGAALAKLWCRRGLRVVAAARRLEKLDALRNELGAEDRKRLLPVVCDVRDEPALKSLFTDAASHFGSVDVLVNSAGLGYQTPLIGGETELWREMLEVNVLALCVATREAIEHMARQGSEGHIFHISSMSAHRATQGSGMYGASKAAVRSLTESLRRELHERQLPIRISSVSPGFVETEFHARFYGDPEKAEALYRSMKALTPQDVADCVNFALEAPPHMQVHDVLLRGKSQAT